MEIIWASLDKNSKIVVLVEFDNVPGVAYAMWTENGGMSLDTAVFFVTTVSRLQNVSFNIKIKTHGEKFDLNRDKDKYLLAKKFVINLIEVLKIKLADIGHFGPIEESLRSKILSAKTPKDVVNPEEGNPPIPA